MLERDEAADHLQRLADPTIRAFAKARTEYTTRHQKPLDGIRQRIHPAIAAVYDGVGYWVLFSTFLAEELERVGGVVRLRSHPSSHWWLVDDLITVQLKSDTGNLPLDQLTIPGLRPANRASNEFVVLTWDHDHADRFDPAFVQLDGKREAWRMPVASLLSETPAVLRPAAPKPKVSSTRRDDAETGATDSPS